MTKDLALCISKGEPVTTDKYLTTQQFMEAVEVNFREKLRAAL